MSFSTTAPTQPTVAVISTAGPTERDLACDVRLREMLGRHGLFASAQESSKREDVLGQLSQLCKDWSRRVSIGLGFPADALASANAKIFTFGSYRLGVYNDGSDTDTLCVGPAHIPRDEFFRSLPEVLRTRPEITSITAVQDAYVPVLKLEFSGLPIDLVYASVGLKTIPEDLSLESDSFLKTIAPDDEQSIRSVNGSRVTDGILNLVPNVEVFRLALRLIKFWAKQRGIYANKVGYLGGVSWAILVARTCQLYPNACASTIVSKLFRVFTQWRWPDPVMLRPIVPESAICGNNPTPPAFRVWNPKQYIKDRGHHMPIITPAFPSMNSTYNVSLSTRELMMAELKRGLDLTADIASKPDSGEAVWEELCERTDFFRRYKHYLELELSAADEAEFSRWEGWVESRIRLLVATFESIPGIWCALPFLEPFTPPPTVPSPGAAALPPPPASQRRQCYYLALQFEHPPAGSTQAPPKIDLTMPTATWILSVKSWPGYAPTMELNAHYMRRSQLPQFVIEQDAERRAKTLKRPKPVSSSGTTPDLMAAAAASTLAPPVPPPISPEPILKRQSTSTSVPSPIPVSPPAAPPVVSEDPAR